MPFAMLSWWGSRSQRTFDRRRGRATRSPKGEVWRRECQNTDISPSAAHVRRCSRNTRTIGASCAPDTTRVHANSRAARSKIWAGVWTKTFDGKLSSLTREKTEPEISVCATISFQIRFLLALREALQGVFRFGDQDICPHLELSSQVPVAGMPVSCCFGLTY